VGGGLKALYCQNSSSRNPLNPRFLDQKFKLTVEGQKLILYTKHWKIKEIG